jgi:hypothetical protein
MDLKKSIKKLLLKKSPSFALTDKSQNGTISQKTIKPSLGGCNATSKP